MGFILMLSIPATIFANRKRAYVFEELYFRRCGNPCILQPRVGDSFQLEYEVTKRELAMGGRQDFTDLTLNGKRFENLEAALGTRGRFPFTQYLFFEDHRFQMYQLYAGAGTRTSFAYYFVRIENEFFLLNTRPIPTLSYDYANEKGRKENERFYGDFGLGGYDFSNSPGSNPQTMRTYYRLGDGRFTVIERQEL